MIVVLKFRRCLCLLIARVCFDKTRSGSPLLRGLTVHTCSDDATGRTFWANN